MMGHVISFYFYHNIYVTPNLDVRIDKRRDTPEFDNYTSYINYIITTLKELHVNAISADRKVRYSPLTTTSSGYDSIAATVLSRCIDCTHAVTFTRARGWRRLNDSGARIAAKLGFQVQEFDRRSYRGFDDFPEADTFGWPSEFASIRESLSQKLLFTGILGDAMWDRNCHYVGKEIVRQEWTGTNLGDLRYKCGFIHVPIPSIAATSLPSVYRISGSEEMRPWALGSNYDRPIPRRLIEEAGISRGSFAQRKKAAAISAPHEGFKSTMAASSYDDFRKFLRRHWRYQRIAASTWATAFRNLRTLNVNAKSKLGYIPLGRWRLSLPVIVPDISIRGKESFLLHWAMEKLVDQYNSACVGAVGRFAVYRGKSSSLTQSTVKDSPEGPFRGPGCGVRR
jgi:hypothetical protein